MKWLIRYFYLKKKNVKELLRKFGKMKRELPQSCPVYFPQDRQEARLCKVLAWLGVLAVEPLEYGYMLREHFDMMFKDVNLKEVIVVEED